MSGRFTAPVAPAAGGTRPGVPLALQAPAVSPEVSSSPAPAASRAQASRRSTRVPAGCVSVAQACALLGMSRDTFDRHLKSGELQRLGLVEANRIGQGRRFFEARSLDDVLWRRRVGGLRTVRTRVSA